MQAHSIAAVDAAVTSAQKTIRLASANNESFIGRAYNGGDLTKYRARIRATGFSGHDRVLDAGCGFGQWTVVLSEINAHVVATDIDPTRIAVAENISRTLGIENVEFSVAAMSGADLRSGDFDAIFSFSALEYSPYRETLKEFHRLLRKGGLLYFNACDLGWMLHNIFEVHNPAADFDPRQWAIDAIQHTLNYFGGAGFSQRNPRDSLLIPREIVRNDLLAMDFEILSVCGDGMTSTFGEHGQKPFFLSEKYGLPAVYEMLCRKR